MGAVDHGHAPFEVRGARTETRENREPKPETDVATPKPTRASRWDLSRKGEELRSPATEVKRRNE